MSSLRISAHEALDSLLERNIWVWVKAPVLLYLAWAFFLPALWKIGLLLLASVACAFVSPCIVAHNVNDFHLWFMLISQGIVLYLVFWYTTYVFAYLQRPGWASRLFGVIGVAMSPFVVLAAGLGVGIVGLLLRMPYEDFWAFFDRWTPVESWKVLR